MAETGRGIDIVIDYLWGQSAEFVIVAVAKAAEDGRSVRFVHVGGASRGEYRASRHRAALLLHPTYVAGSVFIVSKMNPFGVLKPNPTTKPRALL
jgi:hypothetical protein